MTLRETAFFWVGTNANLFFVSVGVIAFELGLNLWEALVAVVLGTQPVRGWSALASIGGVRVRAADHDLHTRGLRVARQSPERRSHVGGARSPSRRSTASSVSSRCWRSMTYSAGTTRATPER